MFESHSPAVYELLRDQRLVSAEQLDALEAERRTSGRSLADLAITRGFVERPVLLGKIAGQLGCGYVADLPDALPDATVTLLAAPLAHTYGVIPWRADARSIDLLAGDPFNSQIAADLGFALGREVRLLVGDPDGIDALVRRHYGEDAASLADVLNEFQSREQPGDSAGELSAREVEAMAAQTPVIRFVNLVLSQAIREQASDIHFEPFERDFKIRYRIDGALYDMTPPPLALALPVVSRLKVLASLNIAERRVPQDGRIRLALAGRPVDLRVSTLPTQFGESVVLRVLDASAVQLDLGQLGMPAGVRAGVEDAIRRPNGIFVVTGPTGSGKTTTLYGALRAIDRPGRKILTVEDPVEYEIDGIMQVSVNPAAGLTFASALRAFLRQDPDTIMVGEIRDLETAQISVQAALTGHLVLSTLHTNDAAGAIARLIDLGVEPFLISATLEGVLAQRLVRRVCPRCRAACAPEAALLAQLGLDPDEAAGRYFYRGRGCAYCGHTHYRGRLGLFEWLPVTEAIRGLIGEKSRALSIRKKAIEQGMRTLREEGLRAIFDGTTTIEEVIKST
jgi:type IV pilus assembly protein PilB